MKQAYEWAKEQPYRTTAEKAFISSSAVVREGSPKEARTARDEFGLASYRRERDVPGALICL